jgi:hypothetical protein
MAGEVIVGAFVGLDETTLTQMRTDWLNCLTALAVGGQSYAIAGRNMTRANLQEVKMIILEINHALRGGGVPGAGLPGGSGGGFSGTSVPFPSFSAPTTFAS